MPGIGGLTMESASPHRLSSKEANGSLELTNSRSTALISPAIAWLLSGAGSTGQGGPSDLRAPKLEEAVDFGPVQENVTTTVGADGSVSTEVKEDISDIGFKATGVGEE